MKTVRPGRGTGKPRGCPSRCDFARVENFTEALAAEFVVSAIPNSRLVDACGKRAPALHSKTFPSSGTNRLTDIREGPPT
ncbi:hypothetical protein ABH973_006736 [Bradyrhizobium ottawaense]|uniref:hypothetical protein n=1 Tax=Bradyrhizobium ottawaense TaxID=931866 RepID=UPI0035150784